MNNKCDFRPGDKVRRLTEGGDFGHKGHVYTVEKYVDLRSMGPRQGLWLVELSSKGASTLPGTWELVSRAGDVGPHAWSNLRTNFIQNSPHGRAMAFLWWMTATKPTVRWAPSQRTVTIPLRDAELLHNRMRGQWLNPEIKAAHTRLWSAIGEAHQ
jgi:hypothetical protein